MEHRPLSELSSVADLKQPVQAHVMSRRERLDRWAELLEQQGDRQLRTLDEIEWKPKAERRAMRADDSALTVAFEDPVLRAEGLASDRLGDAMAFFRLTDADAHFALCSCIYGQSMQAGVAARRVRMLAHPGISRCDVTRHDLSTLWIAGTGLTGIVAASALLHLLY